MGDAVCTSSSSLEFILTQAFHLTGENLSSESLYVTCLPLLSWDDDDHVGEDITKQQLSRYTINSYNSRQVDGTWLGNIKAFTKEPYPLAHEKIFFIGNITWNTLNPLIQHRDLNFVIDLKESKPLPTHGKILIKQTWIPQN
jgi:hypothetical protein